MAKSILKNKAIAAISMGAVTALLATIFLLTNAFNSWHLKIADTLYANYETSDEIVIIGIDEKSTKPSPEGLGQFSKWSRENYTELLKILNEDEESKPRAIVFDLLFDTQTQEIPIEKIKELKYGIDSYATNKEKLETYEKFIEENSSLNNNSIDEALVAKLNETPNVILWFSSNYGDPVMPLKKFRQNTGLGDGLAQVDEDGVLRKVNALYKDGDTYYANLGLAALQEYKGYGEISEEDVNNSSLRLKNETGETNIPLENGKMYVNFFENPGYKIVPFIDVINGNVDKETFKDKIVLIGVTELRSIQDKVTTPLSEAKIMAGVEFWANEIQTILEGKFLTNQSTAGKIATIIIISLLLSLAVMYLGTLLSSIITLLAIVGYYMLAHIMFRNGLILNMIYPFMAIALTFIVSWIYKYTVADRKKRELKSAFGHYVSDKLVEEISKNPEMVKLGGEKREVTVFFSDIKDSTKISEQMDTEAWVTQINEYFTMMENVIKQVGGTIDKYEGDAIMGFFNAPVLQENHRMLAYLCAIEMKKALSVLHKKWEGEGKPLLEFRIGINTGEVIVGNFGSKDRFDYTVMGDTVNTASRLESSANKTYGTRIMAAGTGKAGEITIREIDTVLLPGKAAPVVLYEIICTAKEATGEIKEMIQAYESGLEAYRKKDISKAMEHFEKLARTGDAPSQIMLERCQKLSKGEKVTGLDENMVFRIFNK